MKAAHTSPFSAGQRLRNSIRKSGGFARVLLVALVAGAASTTAPAQGLIPYAFGINNTQSGLSAGKTTDLKNARMNIIRLGGKARNNEAFCITLWSSPMGLPAFYRAVDLRSNSCELSTTL